MVVGAHGWRLATGFSTSSLLLAFCVFSYYLSQENNIVS